MWQLPSSSGSVCLFEIENKWRQLLPNITQSQPIYADQGVSKVVDTPPSGGFKGGKGGCTCTSLWRLVMLFFVYIQQQQPGTVTHMYQFPILISRRLSRPRVASRYSVRTSAIFSLASYDKKRVVNAFMWCKWAWQPKNLDALCVPVAQPPFLNFVNTDAV